MVCNHRQIAERIEQCIALLACIAVWPHQRYSDVRHGNACCSVDPYCTATNSPIRWVADPARQQKTQCLKLNFTGFLHCQRQHPHTYLAEKSQGLTHSCLRATSGQCALLYTYALQLHHAPSLWRLCQSRAGLLVGELQRWCVGGPAQKRDAGVAQAGGRERRVLHSKTEGNRATHLISYATAGVKSLTRNSVQVETVFMWQALPGQTSREQQQCTAASSSMLVS
jgi:hypothetical protein